MNVVLDASVVVKWVLQDSQREYDTEVATHIMHGIAAGDIQATQPDHWLAEVAAVLARLTPLTARKEVTNLSRLELRTLGDTSIYARACQLGVDLQHHLFDTLYHAVALETGSRYITADSTYWRKAQHIGSSVPLSRFSL